MSNLTACERLELIRHKDRPTVNDYIPAMFTRFMEFHGDRLFGDDAAIIGGIGYLSDTPVTVIAQVKGRGKQAHEFLHAPPGGLPQGTPSCEAGGEVPPSGDLPCGHSRRILRR